MDYDVDRYAVIPQLLRERDVARSALATMDANVRQLEVESKDLETRLSEELKCRQEMLDTLASVDQRLKEVLHGPAHQAQMTAATSPADVQNLLNQEPTVHVETRPAMPTLNDSASMGEATTTNDSSGNPHQPHLTDTPSSRAQDNHPILHEKYPTIARIDGRVVAISCFVEKCRANGNGHTAAKYLRGVRGLKNHIERSHPKLKGVSEAYVAHHCTKRLLPAADAHRIEKGLTPRTMIVRVYGAGRTRATDKKRRRAAAVRERAVSPEDVGINDKYKHIVRINGQWVELSCKICGANWNPSRNCFFTGRQGMKNHLQFKHQLKAPTEDTFIYCSQRIVSDRDIQLMSGNPPQEPIDCKIHNEVPHHESSVDEDGTPLIDIRGGNTRASLIDRNSPKRTAINDAQLGSPSKLGSKFKGSDRIDSPMWSFVHTENITSKTPGLKQDRHANIETFSISSDGDDDEDVSGNYTQ